MDTTLTTINGGGMWVRVAAATIIIAASIANAAIELARDGKSDYTIVIPASPTAVEQTAARELQEHLKLVTGAQLPIARSAPGHKIVIYDSNSLGPDGII